ncbi:MAG: DUF1150 family protein [Alphaproteobacteria bacterium]
MTPSAFLALGTPQLAYVRPIVIENAERWAIFAADGTGLGVVAARDLAFAAARQHDLEPVAVH